MKPEPPMWMQEEAFAFLGKETSDEEILQLARFVEKVVEKAAQRRAAAQPETERESWLTTPLGSMGRVNIHVDQYEELRALACKALGVRFVSLRDVLDEERRNSPCVRCGHVFLHEPPTDAPRRCANTRECDQRRAAATVAAKEVTGVASKKPTGGEHDCG